MTWEDEIGIERDKEDSNPGAVKSAEMGTRWDGHKKIQPLIINKILDQVKERAVHR